MKNQTSAEAVALAALGWTLSDDGRASRFLALTGLTPDALKARIDKPEFLAASLLFLEGHEPDLLACAEAMKVAPSFLVDARRELEP
ncbi:MAG TPA: DUF3572 domain-containing protein [Allosphingosinicella sp.]|nr:DUF3572 domain-containing protein [Allosphingosinicella sp.]